MDTFITSPVRWHRRNRTYDRRLCIERSLADDRSSERAFVLQHGNRICVISLRKPRFMQALALLHSDAKFFSLLDLAILWADTRTLGSVGS